MDISTLPEAEQKQLQQLQQQFQEHQAKQQQQQQQNRDYASQIYVPTQAQSYDQSYYSYHQQYEQQQQQQQYYAYHQPSYGTGYQAPHQQQPGASAPQEGATVAGSVGAGSSVGLGQVEGAGYPVRPGLNPPAAAAVAALSQLAQFAGTMAGLQATIGGVGAMVGSIHQGPVSMRPLGGQPPYSGGGKRAAGPFRGARWGNFNQRYPRPGSSSLPFHIRGRGRGRGGRGRGGPRRFQPRGVSSCSHQEPSADEDTELTNKERGSSADVPEEVDQASQSIPASEKLAPNQRPSKGAWCEICRVECTSLEILEQHRNGKRHKKNLLRMEVSKNAVKPEIEIQNDQNPTGKSEVEVFQHPDSAQDSEGNKPEENISVIAFDVETKMDSEQQNTAAGQNEVSVAKSSEVQTRKPGMDWFDNSRRGMKRKMRGGRGGKNMRTFKSPRWPIEPPKPKVVIPLICDLCNVKCDTQEVLDRHLSGKKHIAKLKRFEGHQAMYGPVGLKALYPPNPIAQTLFLPQGHQQHFYGHQGSYPLPGAYMPPQTHQAEPAATSLDPQYQQNPKPQGSEAAPQIGRQGTFADAPGDQQNSAIVDP